MKYVPINVKVPGSEDELDLAPHEARKLVERLQRQLDLWDDLVKKVGVKQARSWINECRRQRRRFG